MIDPDRYSQKAPFPWFGLNSKNQRNIMQHERKNTAFVLEKSQ